MALAAGTVATARPAEACMWPGRMASLVNPKPTDTQAPTNSELAILIYGESLTDVELGSFELREIKPDGGRSSVPVQAIRSPHATPYELALRLRPSAPLSANTTYEAVDLGEDPFGPVLGSFTTGNAADTAPPPAPAVTAVVDAADVDGGSCTPGERRLIHFTVDGGSEPVAYTVLEDGGVIASNERLGPAMVVCAGSLGWEGRPFWALSPGPHVLDLVAVDRAGNVSPSARVVFEVTCGGASEDGGTTDGGAEPHSGVVVDEDGGDEAVTDGGYPLPRNGTRSGCGQAGGGASTCILVIAAAWLLLRRGRRTMC